MSTTTSVETVSSTISKLTLNAEANATARPTSILHRVPYRPPIATSAHGIYVTLEDGRTIIDAVGGASVACIGNGHPEVLAAIKEQVDKVCYVYNMQLSNEPAEELAKLLVESGKGAFASCGFVSGGSEAMEAVMKLARQFYVEQKQPQRTHFISRNLSFHGNSLGTLCLSGHPARRGPYEGILDQLHFDKVSPAYAKRFKLENESDEAYVERLAKELEDKILELGAEKVIGFVAETVVGATTGCVAAPKGYFKAMKDVCRRYNILFILDEVMSGMGRLGTTHAWESFGDGAAPDIQAVAKGLGGGYASIGAVLMSQEVANGIRDKSGFWAHGHTYQAHPLACAASLAVQKVIVKENLLENCRKQGEKLSSLLRTRLYDSKSLARPYTFDIRGGGLFWGIEFDFPDFNSSLYSGEKLDFKGKHFAMLVQARCLEKGLVIMGFYGGASLDGSKGEHCILSPAYNVTDEEVLKIVDLFVQAVEEVLVEAKVA